MLQNRLLFDSSKRNYTVHTGGSHPKAIRHLKHFRNGDKIIRDYTPEQPADQYTCREKNSGSIAANYLIFSDRQSHHLHSTIHRRKTEFALLEIILLLMIVRNENSETYHDRVVDECIVINSDSGINCTKAALIITSIPNAPPSSTLDTNTRLLPAAFPNGI